MTIEQLGYNRHFEKFRLNSELENFEIGRIIAEHKERYIVKNEKGEFEAEITGNLRFSATSREDFPAVGDWVTLIQNNYDFVIIHSILPRASILSRQAVNKFGERQVIATNIDYALILQAVNRDFNINRLERYLTICYSSKVQPIIILNKIDLITNTELTERIHLINERIKQVPIIPISNLSQDGIHLLDQYLQKNKTYCLLGSSGVGKSTFINNLLGKEVMVTGAISKSIDRGKHITTHRELIVTEKGIFIDNPGMREIGMTDSSNGLDITFDEIIALSELCKFSDCKHINEINCAVLDALNNGEIDKSSYQNYLKMKREQEHFELTVLEKRKKDKDFGKMMKNYKKNKKFNP